MKINKACLGHHEKTLYVPSFTLASVLPKEMDKFPPLTSVHHDTKWIEDLLVLDDKRAHEQAFVTAFKALLCNILPPHVAAHFLTAQRQIQQQQPQQADQLYSQSYTNVGVLFASIPNFAGKIKLPRKSCQYCVKENLCNFALQTRITPRLQSFTRRRRWTIRDSNVYASSTRLFLISMLWVPRLFGFYDVLLEESFLRLYSFWKRVSSLRLPKSKRLAPLTWRLVDSTWLSSRMWVGPWLWIAFQRIKWLLDRFRMVMMSKSIGAICRYWSNSLCPCKEHYKASTTRASIISSCE